MTEHSPPTHRPPLPVDTGWAWFIMLGALINYYFAFGFIRSLSIFFLEFLDKFKESTAITTLSFSLNTAAASLFSILMPSVFLSRFSVRSLTLFGATVNALSIVALAFAPNIVFVNIILTILGAAHPFIFIPQLTLLGIYFKKRLSFAVGCANIGVSLATMTSPLLTQILLDKYGLQDALLIHGGLALHGIAAGLLFRSPELYSSAQDPKENSYGIETQTSQEEEQEEESHFSVENTASTFILPNANPNSSRIVIHPIIENGEDNTSAAKDPLIQDTKNPEDIKANSGQKSLTKNEFTRYKSSDSLNAEMNSCSKNLIPDENHQNSIRMARNKHELTLEDMSSNHETDYISKNSIHSINSSYLRDDSISQVIESPCPTSEFELNSNYGLLRTEQDGGISESLATQTTSGHQTLCCCSVSTLSIKNSVCFHPLGILLLLMVGVGVNTQCAAAYMPSLGKEQGVPKHQLPYLMTVIGVCDMCKVGFGYLADRACVRRIYIALFNQVVIGVTFQFVSFFQGFFPMTVFCVLFGANTEVPYVLFPGITVDLLGAEFIGQIMSGISLINGVVISTNHLLIGLLKDETDSFTGGYHFMGGLVLFSAVLILLEPVFTSFVPRDKRATGTVKACLLCSRENEGGLTATSVS